MKHIIYKAIYVATLYTYKYLYNTKYKIQKKYERNVRNPILIKKIKVAENKSKRNNNKK